MASLANVRWKVVGQLWRHIQHNFSPRSSYLPAVVTSRCNSGDTSASVPSTPEKINVSMDENRGVATLQMNNKPVNSLTGEFITEFLITLDKLEQSNTCRGVVIASGLPKVFCGGLDIKTLYNAPRERMEHMYRGFQEIAIRMYGSHLATVVAIDGHAPAGGCVISLTCDYRAMTGDKNYIIGLNEVQLGIIAPFWVMDLMKNTVGLREAERGLGLGLLYSAEEAFQRGLVDQIVPSTDIYKHANAHMDKLLAVSDHARQITKSILRKPFVDRLIAKREADIKNFVDYVSKDSIQKIMGVYIENLKKGKK